MQPNIIQNPLINERVTKWAGLRQSQSISTISPELQPVVIVDDLSRTGKLTTVPTVRQWWARATITAANFGQVRVENFQAVAQDRGSVHRIRAVTICCPNTPSFGILIGLFNFNSTSGAAIDDRQITYIDGRLLGRPNLDVRILDAVGAPDPLTFQYEERNQGGSVRRIDFANPPVLSPGFSTGTGKNLLIIAATIVGTTMGVTIEGEEEANVG